MMPQRTMATALALAVSLIMTACGETEPAPESASAPVDELAAKSPAKPEASVESEAPVGVIELAPDHTLKFYQVEPGEVAVLETAPAGTPQVLAGTAGKTLEQVWNELDPLGRPAPSAVVAASADQEPPGADELATPAAPAPKHASDGGKGNVFYNADDHEWFVESFCQGVDVCQTHMDWSLIETPPATDVVGHAMAGSEGRTTPYLQINAMYSNGWRGKLFETIMPGYALEYSLRFNTPRVVRIHLESYEPQTQISLSAKWSTNVQPPPPKPEPVTYPSHLVSWECRCGTGTFLPVKIQCFRDDVLQSVIADHMTRECYNHCWPEGGYVFQHAVGGPC